ncbi:MAG: sugar ABC transporter permease [Acholeplasma sp.]|nr:sugar ABC transporter permease [Acholeplasma sp.]
MKKTKKLKSKNENLAAYMFLLPWLIGFVILVLYPLFETIYYSFFDVAFNIDGKSLSFIGFKNYYDALFENTEFTPLIIQFLVMEFTYVPAILILSLILALLLNTKIKFRGAFRLIYFFPVVIMSGPVMKQLQSSGSMEIMDASGIMLFRMLSNFSPALANVVSGIFSNFTMILWFTGIPVVLFLNGLQRINKQLYEAAEIDGANKWQILWKISVPNLKSTAMLVSIFIVIQIAIFELNPIYQFVVNDQILKNRLVRLGFASSVVLMYSLIIIALVGIVMLILREKNDEKYLDSLKVRQAKELSKLKKGQTKNTLKAIKVRGDGK